LESFAGALVYATGSIAHGEKLKEIAVGAGLRLSPDGLFELESGSPIEVQDEQDVFHHLGLNFVPPEMREDTGEIERAVDHDFSHIISSNDIRGDLHCHTEWSDGRFPMEEMVEAAQQRDLEYLAITDHSPSATVANGLSPDRLISHNYAVRTMDSISAGIELLTGTEMDIKPDGSLDYADQVLSDLDIVVASIHSGMDQDQATMTNRVIGAMQSPHVDVICHLTARLLERRAPVMMDIEAIFEAAVLTGTVLEINCSPDRLDLKADHVRRAAQLGVIFAISTDSHRTHQFDNLRFGVQTAIRGWVEKKHVLNALTFDELRCFLNLPKPDRYRFIKSRA
jgi:DNA polymerase (family 10)